MNIGQTLGNLFKSIKPAEIGGALLSGLTKEAVKPTVVKWWAGLPVEEKRRVAAEVRDLAGDMEAATGATPEDLDRRIAKLQALKAQGGRTADAALSAEQVGDGIGDLISEITDGTSK